MPSNIVLNPIFLNPRLVQVCRFASNKDCYAVFLIFSACYAFLPTAKFYSVTKQRMMGIGIATLVLLIIIINLDAIVVIAVIPLFYLTLRLLRRKRAV